MIVIGLRLDLYLPGVNSLKEKRRLIKSLLDKINNKFNVSIAEIDNQDMWQRSVIGIVSVSNSRKPIERIFTSLIELVDQKSGIELMQTEKIYY
ncbi:MAG: DUF503 domain-containing protein [Halarsenatibacteraceae bacterium]